MTIAKALFLYFSLSFLLMACDGKEKSVFQTFSDIYEPSGVVQLADGRVLIIEDEKKHPFSLLKLNKDNSFTRLPLSKNIQTKKGIKKIKLDDLEGITLGSNNWVYAITSHSKNSSGKQKKSREKLVRFRVADGQLVDYQGLASLRNLLAKTLPKESMSHLNIEGLAYDFNAQTLLLGFRRPRQQGNAIVVQLKNINEAFEKNDVNKFSASAISLDLYGKTIRSLEYDPVLQAYLLVSGSKKSRDGNFKLWLWNDEKIQPVSINNLNGIAYTEGVTSIKTATGEAALLLVSDDGQRGKSGGHYAIIPYNHLQINP